MRTSKESLPVLLSDQEKIEKGLDLSGLIKTNESLEEQKKASAARFKAEIDANYLKAGDISQVLKDGFEFRLVEVIEEKDWQNFMIRVIRTDTGAVVRSRTMTMDERQEALFQEEERHAPEVLQIEGTVADDDDNNGGIIYQLGQG